MASSSSRPPDLPYTPELHQHCFSPHLSVELFCRRIACHLERLLTTGDQSAVVYAHQVLVEATDKLTARPGGGGRDQSADGLDTPLSEIGLPDRMLTILEYASMLYVRDLAGCDQARLRLLPMIGEKGVAQIVAAASGRGLDIPPGPARPANDADMPEAVLSAIRSYGPLKPSDMEAILGGNSRILKKTIAKLTADNQLVELADGCYDLPVDK